LNNDAGEHVVVILQSSDLLVGFGQPALGRVEFLSELALAVRDLALSADLGVEQAFEVGKATSQDVPFDVGFLCDGDDRRRAVRAQGCAGQEPGGCGPNLSKRLTCRAEDGSRQVPRR
jgi:hypothetical protein